MLTNSGKDAVQLKKAKIKTGAVVCIIPELIKLNNALTADEQKPYLIVLDYEKHSGFYKFTIDINKSHFRFSDSLISVHFSLKNKEEGISLLNEVMDSYMQNNEMVYTGFHNLENFRHIVDSYDAVGKNKIDLQYKIHSSEEHDKLQEYDKSLYKNPSIAKRIQKKLRSL